MSCSHLHVLCYYAVSAIYQSPLSQFHHGLSMVPSYSTFMAQLVGIISVCMIQVVKLTKNDSGQKAFHVHKTNIVIVCQDWLASSP